MKKLTLFVILFTISYLSYALDTSSCTISSSNGILDSILKDYYLATYHWRDYLAPKAITLYWFWFTLEFSYQLVFKKVLANDVNKLWYFMMVRVFSGYMFSYIFVGNHQGFTGFYDGIITYFVKLGAGAGGFIITPNSDNPFNTLSPSGVLNTGTCLFNNMQSFMSTNITGHPIDTAVFAMPMLISIIIVYLLSALIALTLIITALEAYIILNAGVILCGFAGSSWTMGFWNKYLSYVGGIAVRLFIMCLILGLMKNNLESQFTTLMTLSSLTDYGLAWGILIKVLISMFIYAFLIIKIPSMAGSMLTGSVNAGLGDVIAGASMMLAGAGLAAGLAKMGVNFGSGGGGGGAKELFKDTLRGNGGGGLPSVNGGSSSDAMRTASQTAQSATSSAEKAQGIAELSKDLKGTSATSGQSSPSSNGSSSSAPKMNSATTSSPSSNNATSNKSSPGPQNNTSGDNSSSGGISGNEKIQSEGSPNNNQSNSSNTSKDEKKPSKAMQDMIKHKDSLIKNFEKMSNNSHSGSAEINLNPHKE